jgi:uncharacterized phosphosugar-binding protein
MTSRASDYAERVQLLLKRVSREQYPSIRKAGAIIAKALDDGGVIQVFGTGHSEALAMELAGRAGGLVPTNRIALRDLVMFGGDAPAVLEDLQLERDPMTARRLFQLVAPRPQDVFVIASQSGINGSVVEMALIAQAARHPVIAITSLDHTAQTPSRHHSGRKLADVADVVLDNGAPFGDAVLDLHDGGRVCGVSSISAALLAQQLVAEVVECLEAVGRRPPVYLSANVPGGDAHNHALEAAYAGRIRRSA